MATFFLLAGFFGHMSLHKKGLRALVADRLRRIGITLVVGWPIPFRAIVAVTIWGADVMAHSEPPQLPSAFPELPAFPLTHLWFLYVLFWLCAATLLQNGLVVLVDRHVRLRARIDGVVRWLVENPFGYDALALPLALTLYFLFLCRRHLRRAAVADLETLTARNVRLAQRGAFAAPRKDGLVLGVLLMQSGPLQLVRYGSRNRQGK